MRGTDVAVAGLDAGAAADAVLPGIDEGQLGEVEVCELVVLLDVWGEDVVAQAKVERQTRKTLPVILEEAGVLRRW